MDETRDVADELYRLARCADIPAYRRRQLAELALQLAPEPFQPPHGEPESIFDPYYRSPGMKMRLRRSDLKPSPASVLLITARDP